MLTSGQVWSGLYVAKNASGEITTPTIGPTGVLYVDGVADAAAVSISGTNPYYWSVTLPTISSAGVVTLYITATISGVSTAEIAAEESTYAGNAATSGTNILTATEAATALRCLSTDQNMLDLLPLVDRYIEHATGRDWTLDVTIYPEAKAAARMLLVRWHEDPGGMAAGDTLGPGIRAALTQLEWKAEELKSTAVAPAESLAIVYTNVRGDMAIDASFVVVFNHKMATATSGAVLQDSAGSVVATTNSWDVTYRQLTVNPNASLSAASGYSLVLTDVADVYGGTISATITIRTA